MKRFPVLLLCLAACTTDKAPRPTTEATRPVPPGVRHTGLQSTPYIPPDTTAHLVDTTVHRDTSVTATLFFDSTVSGDTMRFARGRDVDTLFGTDTLIGISIRGEHHVVTRVTDSTWARIPLPSPPLAGIPFGLFYATTDSLCADSYGYTTSVILGDPATLTTDLDKIAACHGHAIIAVRRLKQFAFTSADHSGDSVLSVSKSIAEMQTWPQALIQQRVTDGVVLGIYIADDVTGPYWGGPFYTNGYPTQPTIAKHMEQWDSIGCGAKALWPGVMVAMRARPIPDQLGAKTGGWSQSCVDAAWSQYNGMFWDGEPQPWAASQASLAEGMGLRWVVGINELDGGCGPASIQAARPVAKRCRADAPGTAQKGTVSAANRYQMTAAELTVYGKILAAEPKACALIGWRNSVNLPSTGTGAEDTTVINFNKRVPVQDATRTIAALTRAHPSVSCRR